jgi:hypothetical protein
MAAASWAGTAHTNASQSPALHSRQIWNCRLQVANVRLQQRCDDLAGQVEAAHAEAQATGDLRAVLAQVSRNHVLRCELPDVVTSCSTRRSKLLPASCLSCNRQRRQMTSGTWRQLQPGTSVRRKRRAMPACWRCCIRRRAALTTISTVLGGGLTVD